MYGSFKQKCHSAVMSLDMELIFLSSIDDVFGIVVSAKTDKHCPNDFV